MRKGILPKDISCTYHNKLNQASSAVHLSTQNFPHAYQSMAQDRGSAQRIRARVPVSRPLRRARKPPSYQGLGFAAAELPLAPHPLHHPRCFVGIRRPRKEPGASNQLARIQQVV